MNPAGSHSIILFDGVCNFCNSLVNFIIANDKKDNFRFAAQQSEIGLKILNQHSIHTTSVDTFYLIQNEKVYTHSTAVLKMFRLLPLYLKWISVFIIIPKFIRDFLYDLIAKYRYIIFGKRDKCMIPSEKTKAKFLS